MLKTGSDQGGFRGGLRVVAHFGGCAEHEKPGDENEKRQRDGDETGAGHPHNGTSTGKSRNGARSATGRGGGIVDPMRTLTITILAAGSLLLGCSNMNEPQTSTQEEHEQPEQGSSLEERAARIGVPLALAESWEKSGVHIGDGGVVYADECPVSRKVKIPAGIKIIC